MKNDRPESPRFVVSVAEILIVVAIVSAFGAFLLPAVDAARTLRRLPPVLPRLQPWHEDNPWAFLIGAPIVVTATVAASIGLARFFLPKSVRAYYRWGRAPGG